MYQVATRLPVMNVVEQPAAGNGIEIPSGLKLFLEKLLGQIPANAPVISSIHPDRRTTIFTELSASFGDRNG